MSDHEQRIEDAWRRWMNSPEGNNSSWLSFEAGWLARDAEVQALRERNGRLAHELFVLGVDIDAPNDEAVQAFREALEKIARAALAGGEEGETE